MKNLLILLLVTFSFESSAEIYKWIDKNGVTHYGRNPNGEEYQVVAVKENKTKPIPKEIEELDNSLKDGLLKDHGDSEKVDCKKAVSNSLSGINTMLEVGAKNYRDGYMEKSTYDKQSKALRKIKSEISISDCRNASDQKLGFYKCMSNDYNHVAHCGKKYSN